VGHGWRQTLYLLLLNFVTDLVPSEMACLLSSPGRMRRTAVWISRDEIVDFLLYDASFEASAAMRSKMSCTNELRTGEGAACQTLCRRCEAHPFRRLPRAPPCHSSRSTHWPWPCC